MRFVLNIKILINAQDKPCLDFTGTDANPHTSAFRLNRTSFARRIFAAANCLIVSLQVVALPVQTDQTKLWPEGFDGIGLPARTTPSPPGFTLLSARPETSNALKLL